MFPSKATSLTKFRLNCLSGFGDVFENALTDRDEKQSIAVAYPKQSQGELEKHKRNETKHKIYTKKSLCVSQR